MDRKTKKQYDGVIYTPGSAARYAQRTQTARKKSRSKKSKKSNFALFYTITLFLGVVICIIVFATMFNSLLPKQPLTPPAITLSPSAAPTPAGVAVDEMLEATGVVKAVGDAGSGRQVTIYDINGFKTYNLSVETGTELKNKYGQNIAFAELSAGEIVDIRFETRSNRLDSLVLSAQAWEQKQISKVNVDYVEQTVTVYNDVYTYTDELICLYKGAVYAIEDITPLDIVTLKGYTDKLWYAELVKSHGYLDFTGKELVMDGILEIDTNYSAELNSVERIEILEGVHRIVIRGGNIEPFSQEVIIENGGVVTLDLNEVQFRMGIINIKTDVEGWSLYVDGEPANLEEPLMLDYGSYYLRVVKEGYLPWEDTVTLESPLMDVEADLREEVLMCKVSISTYPTGAEIYIDNSYVGVSPVNTTITYGRHKIIYKKEGYKTMDFEENFNEPFRPFDIILIGEPPVMPGN